MISPTIVVCGLAAEAKIASAFWMGARVIVGGGDGSRLEAALNEPWTKSFVSFGVAGGLDPALRPGDVLVARSVIVGENEYAAHPVWSARIAEALGVSSAIFAGSDTVVRDVAAKAALRRATAAACVDMETHIVARVAAQRGLRWVAIRAVTDPANRALPHAAVVGMRPDGAVDLPAILGSLVKNPAQLPALIRAGADARAAFAALLRCRQLGPVFGFSFSDL